MSLSNLFNKDQSPAEVTDLTPEELLVQIEDWAAEGGTEILLAVLPKMEEPGQYYLTVLALGQAYIKREEYVEAETWLGKVAEQGREDFLWHYRLAEARLFQDNTESALKHALLARGKEPQYPWNYMLLGKLFYFNGNKTAAKEYIQTGWALAREANCDESDFAWLLQEIENGNDPAVLLKA